MPTLVSVTRSCSQYRIFLERPLVGEIMIMIGEPVVDVIEIKPKPVIGERMRLGSVSGHSAGSFRELPGKCTLNSVFVFLIIIPGRIWGFIMHQ